MEDPKIELEHFNKRLLTVEWIALANQLNSEIAICKDAQVGLILNNFYFPLNSYLYVLSLTSVLYHISIIQLIVNGVHGLTGTCAQEAAEEACKEELEPSLFRKEMEENDAQETHWKCETATCNPARVR